MPSYLVQEEDGTSHFTLEDGSGSILLEEEVVEQPPGGGHARIRHFNQGVLIEDEDAIAIVLSLC